MDEPGFLVELADRETHGEGLRDRRCGGDKLVDVKGLGVRHVWI